MLEHHISMVKLNKVGHFLTIGFGLLLIVMNLYFYHLRCEFSPPVSAAGIFIGVIFQIIAVMLFSGFLQYFQATTLIPRVCEKEYRFYLKKSILGFFFLMLFGLGINYQALLSSDTFGKRGSTSVGRVCFDPYTLNLCRQQSSAHSQPNRCVL
ncbi:MAG: hypothetical protein WAU60_11590 [Candidatus Competibacter denitrificans]|jgi:hypothetical protein